MAGGERLCLLHSTTGSTSAGALVFVHPFAEEMNRCRRMAALQARAFAEAGWSVLQIDLHGCGDSSGEFGEATWERWTEDILEAAQWLTRESGHAAALWGLRAGCLLAVDAAVRMPYAPDLLLWQPVISGAQYLRQFLRLGLASRIANSGGLSEAGSGQLRQQLARGIPIEVVGYELSPVMADALEGAELRPPAPAIKVAWLDVHTTAEARLSDASRRRIEQWRSAGHIVDARAVSGPPFWQTPETAECPALIDATLQAVQSWKQGSVLPG